MTLLSSRQDQQRKPSSSAAAGGGSETEAIQATVPTKASSSRASSLVHNNKNNTSFRMSRHPWLSVLSLVLLSSTSQLGTTTTTVDAYAAFQSGPDVGPSFAGGMAYEPELNVVYLTGATYGSLFDPTSIMTAPSEVSSCFLGMVKLPTENTDTSAVNVPLQWIERELYGTRSTTESCTALALATKEMGTPNEHPGVFLIGGTEEGGLLTNIRIPGSHKAKQYGLVLDVTVGSGVGMDNGGVSHNGVRATTLLGGALIQDEAVQYPKAIVADAPTQNFLYVASQHSEDKELSAEYVQDSPTIERPNFTNGGIHKYGNSFGMLIERLSRDEVSNVAGTSPTTILPPDLVQKTLSLTWRKPFGLVGTASARYTDQTVHVAGLIELPDSQALVIVGSTRGSGPAFGEESGNGDMDGFMTKLHVENGSFLAQGENARAVHRLDSINHNDEWVTHVCAPPRTGLGSGGAPEVFYVVGATTGQLDSAAPLPLEGEFHAFISKIDLITLDTIWTKQLVAPDGTAFALGCVVSSDHSLVYVGGGLEDGAALATEISAGGDDFFVAQFRTDDGTLIWVHQVGTSGDDWLAHGTGMAVDKFDNVVVFGDTTGALYRTLDNDPKDVTHERDIFVSIFTKSDGGHIKPTEMTGESFTGGTGDGPQQPVPGFGSFEPPSSTNSDTDKGGKSKFVLVTLLLACTALAAVGFAAKFKHQKDVATERGHVFAYLQGFDVEDVDLRHSATGGWHGTYVNKLAHGVNQSDAAALANPDASSSGGVRHGSSHSGRSSGPPPSSSFSFETAPLSHSSVIKDSLFMDVDSKPTLGLGGGALLTGGRVDTQSSMGAPSSSNESHLRSGGYDGLVGAYDDNWNDLKPRSYEDQKSSLEAGTARNGGKPWGREII
jgi:hypothetical protein